MDRLIWCFFQIDFENIDIKLKKKSLYFNNLIGIADVIKIRYSFYWFLNNLGNLNSNHDIYSLEFITFKYGI